MVHYGSLEMWKSLSTSAVNLPPKNYSLECISIIFLKEKEKTMACYSQGMARVLQFPSSISAKFQREIISIIKLN